DLDGDDSLGGPDHRGAVRKGHREDRGNRCKELEHGPIVREGSLVRVNITGRAKGAGPRRIYSTTRSKTAAPHRGPTPGRLARALAPSARHVPGTVPGTCR